MAMTFQRVICSMQFKPVLISKYVLTYNKCCYCGSLRVKSQMNEGLQ